MDDLSNLLTSSFDPHKEVKINLKGQSWLVLPQELHGRRRKRRKEDKLKLRENGRSMVQNELEHCSPVFCLWSDHFEVSFFAVIADRIFGRGVRQFSRNAKDTVFQ